MFWKTHFSITSVCQISKEQNNWSTIPRIQVRNQTYEQFIWGVIISQPVDHCVYFLLFWSFQGKRQSERSRIMKDVDRFKKDVDRFFKFSMCPTLRQPCLQGLILFDGSWYQKQWNAGWFVYETIKIKSF